MCLHDVALERQLIDARNDDNNELAALVASAGTDTLRNAAQTRRMGDFHASSTAATVAAANAAAATAVAAATAAAFSVSRLNHNRCAGTTSARIENGGNTK